MIEYPACRQFTRRWVVCASSQRWLIAVRRFAPEMIPRPLIPVVVPADPPQVPQSLAGQRQAVVLWEVQPDSLAATCDCLARTAIAFPDVLQLVAGSGLSDLDQIALAEFPSAASMNHPEDLPRLTAMIQGYFASLDQDLD
jgi:hypothetical protein